MTIYYLVAAKTHIDSLFSKQKKGIRAVVPGFINYKYRDGVLPGHTKKYFNEYNILTIHGINYHNLKCLELHS